MRRWLIGGVVVLVALAGGGYYYATQRAQRELQAGLDAFRASLPPGSTFTYASATPNAVARSAHLTDVKVVSGGDIFTAAEADVTPDGPNALRHITLRDATEQAGGVSATVGQLEADGVSMPPGTTKFDPKTAVVDHLALRDFRFTSAAAKLVAGGMTLDSYGRGRPATVDITGLDATATDQSFETATIAHAHLTGLDPTRTDPVAHAMAALQQGTPFAFAMEGVTVKASGTPPATFGSARFEAVPDGSSTGADKADKVAVHMAVQDLVSAPNAEAKPQFDQLGYDKLQLTMKLDGTIDRMERRLQVDQLDIEAVNMGHIHLAVALDNLPPAMMSPGEAAAQMGQAALELAGLQLRSMVLSYDDQSLYGRLQALGAKARHVNPAQMTAQAQAQVRAAAQQFGVPAAVVAPVLAFMADPHRLVVEMHPPQPVPVVGLPSLVRGTPEQTLGLKVTN